MKAVGIRELKNRLSEYIRMVGVGEVVLVTDRGKVVAEIKMPGGQLAENPYPGLWLRSQQGKARLGAKNRADLYPLLKPLLEGSAIRTLLQEERGHR